MKKLTFTINAACVTQNYLSEHGYVSIASAQISSISKKVPKNEIDFYFLLRKVNSIADTTNSEAVELKLEVDEYSHPCVTIYFIRDVLKKIESIIKWDITCTYFFECGETAKCTYTYLPTKCIEDK